MDIVADRFSVLIRVSLIAGLEWNGGMENGNELQVTLVTDTVKSRLNYL